MDKDINSKNSYLFKINYIPKNHEDLLLIQDIDPMMIKLSNQILDEVWNVFIKKEENLSVVNLIEIERLDLKAMVGPKLKNLKTLPKVLVKKELNFILDVVNDHLLIIGDLIFTRYDFASFFYQKCSYIPASNFHVLYSLFLYDRTVLDYLFDILTIINVYQTVSKDLLVEK